MPPRLVGEVLLAQGGDPVRAHIGEYALGDEAAEVGDRIPRRSSGLVKRERRVGHGGSVCIQLVGAAFEDCGLAITAPCA